MDELLRETGIVPVVVIEDANDAEPLANALIEGGLPIIEVTLRTEAALEAISNIATNCPGAIIGAGTVLNVQQLEIAREAGAKFIVSPGLSSEIVGAARSIDLPIYPGIATATELQSAWNLGLKVVKFFPAGLSGGVAMLKALAAVFRDIQFMPTGGVSPENLSEYLAVPSVTACGGSWLAPNKLIVAKEFAEITRLAQAAKKIVIDTRM